ncbi:MAG TPA: DNA-directed RNA polymerase subunit alpha C-terminal domain-containing protein [Chitinophagaceae bacterium]|nr:DNA-directed RNA polymerase subunit alpha C-terminal domain-containing protein [Chitinophagaceae bacterium]
MAIKETLKICRKGHQFYKSSNCPVCPICEAQRKPKAGFASLLSAPARRALESAGMKTEKQLSKFSEEEILKLHGMGKASLPILKRVLKTKRLGFRKK